MRFFQQQGYYNYRLHPVPNIGSGVPMDLYNRFYAFDRWIYYEDIPYEGDYFRWLFMPDQYTFNYALEEVVKKDNQNRSANQPFFFFFININSHYPWKRDRIPVFADWKALNKVGAIGGFVNDLQNQEEAYLYYRAIEYQLDYLTDYMGRSTDENALFILIGDHQPPALPADNFNTPLHIISKDPYLIDSFLQYGLQPGLRINGDETAPLKHEGLYSLLVRELYRNYGTDTLHLPPYYPEGITTD
jgi:phosphoglycerol transferase MdoB-like AlkP superfamily enzyme